MLIVEGLKKTYPESRESAVDYISFTVQKKEIVAILGENGSGKSTLLKLMAGLSEPDEGRIVLNGKKIEGPSKKLVAGYSNIKLIHQNYNLFPNISLKENILYHLRFLPKAQQETRLEEMLELCGLEPIQHKLPRECSGGEQQRAAIAAALSTETDALLLDEPFSNLDVFHKEELRRYLKLIATRLNLSIVFVTHDAEDALSLGNKIIIIKNGAILQTGPPRHVYFLPVNKYVAQITGSNNILKISDLLKIESNNDTLLSLKNNDRALCAIRPENILYNTEHPGTEAEIKSISFHGFQYVARLITVTHVSLVIYVKESFSPGDKIYIRIDPSAIHIFPVYTFKELINSSAFLSMDINKGVPPRGVADKQLSGNGRYLVLYNHHLPAGALYFQEQNEVVTIMGISIQEQADKNTLSEILIRGFENLVREKKFRKITLIAAYGHLPFFSALGYGSQGRKFEEDGVEKIKLLKILKEEEASSTPLVCD